MVASPDQANDPFRGYHVLTSESACAYLADRPELSACLGGSPADWQVREVGDGNINLVFVVAGPAGDLIVKQAQPYLRLVGESWPLRRERSWFEHAAMVEQAKHVGRLVPKVFYFDRAMALIVMERLHPHIILRKGFIQAIVYPRLAADAAFFLAQTLFYTSELALPAAEKQERAAFFSGNTELCKITLDLVFTDPYRVAQGNRWTSPQLDALAAELREDAPLKIAAQRLKWKFQTRAEAMVHGDLHSGSIMATPEDTRFIDPEFSFYGPMGFDIGALIGNLFLAYYSQAGHEQTPGERDEYRAWLLSQVREVWDGFATQFLALWREHAGGEAYNADLFKDPKSREALEAERLRYVRRLFVDTTGFAGVKMIRRVFGLAHVEDLESIADPDRRAACEQLAVQFARRLVLQADQFADPTDWTKLAEQIYAAAHHGG